MHEAQHLTVKVEGVVMPAWLGAALLLTAVASIVTTLLIWNTNRELAREIRVLQLHVQDVESVMIRSGMADRRDIAEWETQRRKK